MKWRKIMGEEIIDIPDKPSKLKKSISKAVDIFHKFGLWTMVAILCGIYIGIKGANLYYKDKMDDCIKVGGFVYKEKVYSVLAK